MSYRFDIKRTLIFVMVCMLGTNISYAQLHNLFFNSSESIMQMNFDTASPEITFPNVANDDFGTNSVEGISHIEDENGNVLFFMISDGVFRADGTQMPGSVGLTANASSAERNICLMPGETDKYYILYQDNIQCSALYYSVVDMSLDGGLGDVSELNVLLDANDHAEGMEVIRIPGTDNYWYLSYRCHTGVDRYKIDETGIGPPIEILATVPPGGSFSGQMELDYHRGKIAFGYAGFVGTEGVLADFNPVTGLASNLVVLDIASYASEFSPDGSKLYLTIDNTELQQYDIATGIYTNLPIETCNGSPFVLIGQIEIGGDGNLYMQGGSTCLIRMENPNSDTPTLVQIDVDVDVDLGVTDYAQMDFVPELTAVVEDVKCFNDVNGSIAISIVGDGEFFDIVWSHDPGNTNTTLSDLPPGDYTITVTDQNGFSVTETYTITQAEELISELEISHPPCFGEPGSVLLHTSGGTNPYTVDWNGIDPNAVPAGNHSVSVTDANGCSLVLDYTVNSPAQITTQVSTIDALCFDGYGLVSIEVFDAGMPYEIDWKGVNPDRVPAGIYEYTVIDANNCSLDGSYLIQEPEALDLAVEFELLDCNNVRSRAITTATGGTEPYEINWFSYDTEYLEPGEYTVALIDGNGCTLSKQVTVEEPEAKVFVPSAFSPNNDGLNDLFIPVIDCYTSFELTIYDRWGKQIFFSDNVDTKWDGRLGSDFIQEGVYYYTLQIVDANNALSDHNGAVSLIR